MSEKKNVFDYASQKASAPRRVIPRFASVLFFVVMGILLACSIAAAVGGTGVFGENPIIGRGILIVFIFAWFAFVLFMIWASRYWVK